MERRPKRSDAVPSTGEKRNCIVAHTIPNSPTYSAARAVAVQKVLNELGSTGTIRPRASISSATVMNMKASGAPRGFQAYGPFLALIRGEAGASFAITDASGVYTGLQAQHFWNGGFNGSDRNFAINTPWGGIFGITWYFH